jgi:hypothetical protein
MKGEKYFKRIELKYLINSSQQKYLLDEMKRYMKEDEFGKSVVNSLYFDTPDFYLIRNSLQKPAYKEKIRIRSYGRANHETKVFIELKKKYKSVVYKRRLKLREGEAVDYMERDIYPKEQSQILKEIDYFKKLHANLSPKMLISCNREAFFAKDDSEFRITFDKNIIYSQDNLSLCNKVFGKAIIKDDETLMEIKVVGGMPLWMTKLLSEKRIFKTSFSKYGKAYKMSKLKKLEKGDIYNQEEYLKIAI